MLFLVLNLGDGSHVKRQLKGSISACGGECRSGAGLCGADVAALVQWAFLDEGILKRRLQEEIDGKAARVQRLVRRSAPITGRLCSQDGHAL